MDEKPVKLKEKQLEKVSGGMTEEQRYKAFIAVGQIMAMPGLLQMIGTESAAVEEKITALQAQNNK